ncbi:hypothetical protein D3C78_1170400 [compost metagenome]
MALATCSVSTRWLLTPVRVCSVTAESSSAAVANWLTPAPIWPSSSARLSRMRSMTRCIWPSSSRRRISTSLARPWDRSPRAMLSPRSRAARSGRQMFLLNARTDSTPKASATNAKIDWRNSALLASWPRTCAVASCSAILAACSSSVWLSMAWCARWPAARLSRKSCKPLLQLCRLCRMLCMSSAMPGGSCPCSASASFSTCSMAAKAAFSAALSCRET